MNIFSTRYSNKIIEIYHKPDISMILQTNKRTRNKYYETNVLLYHILYDQKQYKISSKQYNRIYYCTIKINRNQCKINRNESKTHLIIIKQYYLMELCNILMTYAQIIIITLSARIHTNNFQKFSIHKIQTQSPPIFCS